MANKKSRNKKTTKKRQKQKFNASINYFANSALLLVVILISWIFLGNKSPSPKIISKSDNKNSVVVKPVLPAETVRVPILVYHYVEYVTDLRDTTRKSLNITPYIFEKQLTSLIDAKFNFITARDLGEYLNGKKILPDRPVILTFDDGYKDFYTDVFPILKKHHVVATQYVVPGFTDKLNYMTTDEVKEIAKSGLVEIGAHTMHHAYLPKLFYESALKEIVDSKSELEEKYGVTVVSFAYPYGAFDDNIAKMVEEAGFTNAVTTKGGIEVNQKNRFLLHRIHPGYRVGSELVHDLL